jgi:hypothetical protein
LLLIRGCSTIYHVGIAAIVAVRRVVPIVSVAAIAIRAVAIVIPAKSIEEEGVSIARPPIIVRICKRGIPVPPGRIIVAKSYPGVASPPIVIVVIVLGLVGG